MWIYDNEVLVSSVASDVISLHNADSMPSELYDNGVLVSSVASDVISLHNADSMPSELYDKQRVLMHGHQGWNVRHGLCHINMRYVYIYMSCL